MKYIVLFVLVTALIAAEALSTKKVKRKSAEVKQKDLPVPKKSTPQVSQHRILILTNYATKSHMNILTPLARALIARGHEVTMVSPYSLLKQLPGLKEEVVLQAAEEVFQSFGNLVFTANFKNPLEFIGFMRESLNKTCVSMFTNPRIQEFIGEVSTKKSTLFDVVILNAYFNDCTYAVGYLLADVMVTVSPGEIFSWTARSMGMSANPAVVPMPFAGLLGTQMRFEDRIINVLMEGLGFVIRQLFYERYFQNVMNEYLPGLPPVAELERKMALSLTNHDPVFHVPRSFVPNVIPVPALHCGPSHPLPKDLLDFVESSGESGFILFSLGSIARGSLLPTETREAFLKAFSQLKHKVIWKFEEKIENLPNNVKLVSWIPQQDLLGHPKIRLFISHGGLFSLQETLYHGVPVIGVPLFADQPYNVQRLEDRGIGLRMDISNITSEEILTKVNEILTKPSFAANAEKYSSILKDSPVSSLDSAIFWIEYVVRHQGAPHLQVLGKDFYFFQYFLLDVITVIVLSAFSLFLLLRFIFRAMRYILRCLYVRFRKQKSE